MNGSPATCCEKRVQRAHSTQRSRSSSTWLEMAIGLGYVRFTSWKRDSALPLLIVWFCSGHSPPLSQTGQSSGWLTRMNSSVAFCPSAALGEEAAVRTTIPSCAVSVQPACNFGSPSTSTRHMRQAPTAGPSRGA
jgi:hypothetical protein